MKPISTLLAAALLPALLLGQMPAISGPSKICFEDGNFVYSISGTVGGATAIKWTNSAPGGTINDLPSPQTVSLPAGLSVWAGFSYTGTNLLCAEAVGGTFNGLKSCRTVTKFQPIIKYQPSKVIHECDLPYYWPTEPSAVLTQVGTFNLAATLTSYLGCDSTVVQEVVVKPGGQFGKVFLDNNGNGAYDPGSDAPASGTIEVLSPGGSVKSVNPVFGDYCLSGVNVGDQLIFSSTDPGVVPSPPSYIYQGLNGYDFALTGLHPDWGIDINNVGTFGPGFWTELVLSVVNSGAIAASTVGLVLPPQVQLVHAIPTATSTSGDTLFWDAMPSAIALQQFHITVKTVHGTPIGSQVSLKAFVLAAPSETNLGNNTYLLKRTVFGSFDPNTKEVSRPILTQAEGLAGGAEVEYVVHFQNTGNAPAEDVAVVDSLPGQFDLGSLEVVRSSHPLVWKLDGNALRFDFKNILLPDSASSPLGSCGWVKFRLKTLPGIAPDTKIENHCDIYFDFNPPVRTGDAVTWVEPIGPGGQVDPSGTAQIEVFPNPTSNWVNVKWKHPAETEGIAFLVDAAGAVRHSHTVPVDANTLKMVWPTLPTGQYWVVVQIGAKRMAKQVAIRFGSIDPLRRR